MADPEPTGPDHARRDGRDRRGARCSLLASVVPRPLVLPMVCLVAVAGALVVSLVAWRRGAVRRTQHVTAWDVAGALAFIACAAAIMSDPNQVAALTSTATTVAGIAGAA